MELDEYLVQRTANAGLLFTIHLLMPFGQIEIAYEGVMHQRLQHHTHEARLAHVIEPSEANGAAGEEGRIVDDELVFFGRGRIFILALLAYTGLVRLQFQEYGNVVFAPFNSLLASRSGS